MKPIPIDIPLYGDHQHHVSFARGIKRPLPYHSPQRITEPRPAWYENRANVVRRVLMALNCEEVTHVYGVHIQRTDAHMRSTYHVNADTHGKGAFVRYELDAAIARVLELVEAS